MILMSFVFDESKAKKYRKKPVVIEAYQIVGILQALKPKRAAER